MNPEIQKWYKALEEADRRAEAGDEQAKEDAYKIADTIRQLEAQAESGQYQANLETPAVLGGVTAIPSVVGGAIRMAQSAMSPNSKGSTTTAPAAGGLTQSDIDLQRAGNIGPGGSGLAKEVTHNVQTAERAEEAAKQKKLMAELQRKGVISEPNIPKIAGTTPGGIAVTDKDALVGYGQTTPPKLTPAQRAAAMLNRAPAAAAEGAKKIPGAVVRGAANIPGSRIAGGYSIGALGTDAYNYLELAKEAESRGDQEAAAHYKQMAAISAAGSAAAAKGVTSKTPLGRVLSIPAAGLTFYNYLQSQKGYPAPGEQESNPEAPVTEYAEGRRVPKSKKDVVKAGLESLAQKFGYDPKRIAQQYPEIAPPVMTTDPRTGKTFAPKNLSPEALAVQKARQAAQKEIDKGMMTAPFFDISKRTYVDPANYPLQGRTLTDQVPKKAQTVEKYRALAESPEATERLLSAYRRGDKAPLAKDWYAMKQLEDEFVRELGPDAGRQAFRQRFAEPMAATTGGANPTSNLMMTAYSNYMDTAGKTLPTAAFELPFPVGGRFVSGNMEQANKYRQMGAIPIDNPKRHNFASNFMGYRDRPTIDEQMMGLFAPGKGAPEPGTYGVYEAALNKLAAKEGVNPVNFQDVAWAGAKNYQGKPMMQEINEMIYRTSRITGESPEEVLRGFIRGNKPMYNVTGLGALGAATEGVNNPE